VRDIVIAQAPVLVIMRSEKPLANLEAEQNIDSATAKQLAKIVEFLQNIEE